MDFLKCVNDCECISSDVWTIVGGFPQMCGQLWVDFLKGVDNCGWISSKVWMIVNGFPQMCGQL